MKTQTNIFLPLSGLPLPIRVAPCLKSKFNVPNATPASRPKSSEKILPQQKAAFAFTLGEVEAVLIYVVDDEPHLAELYTIILESNGCLVRTFTDRVQALATLEREGRRPDLLIIDSIGNSVLADQFMNHCLAVCPGLRILMASGLSQSDVHFSSVKPDRFLQKPFTPQEFLSEIRAALIPRP